MAIPDNYIDKITKGNDSRMISPAADMVRVDNDNFDGETLDEVLDDVYSKSEVDTKVKEAGSGAVSVTTNQDGTFVIHVGETDYTINLNHTHENMAKLVVCEESDLPSTLAMDTIYAQVDDSSNPTEIETLYIAGLEFAGGGVPAGTPAITKPSGSSINLGENDGSGVSSQVLIKANAHITGDLTVTLAANSDLSFDTTNLPTGVTYNSGAGTLTIAQVNAIAGVQINIVYSGSGAAEIDGGIVISGGGVTPKSVVVVVAPPYFPEGFLADTAWERAGEQLDVPDQVAGYCTNPFTEDFRFAHDSSHKFDLIIKGGFVKNNGELTRGKIMFKNTLEDTLTNSAYTKSAEPIRLNDTDNFHNTERYHYVSATFKTSEIADCYIYDNVAHAYLWAGKNVDTSVAPQIPNA